MKDKFKIPKGTLVYVHTVGTPVYNIIELPTAQLTQDVIGKVEPRSYAKKPNPWYELYYNIDYHNEFIKCEYHMPIHHPVHGLIKTWFCPRQHLMSLSPTIFTFNKLIALNIPST